MLFTWLGTKLNITEKPEGIEWADIIPVSLLAGIGFTMSILATYLVSSMIYLYKQKTDHVIEAKSA